VVRCRLMIFPPFLMAAPNGSGQHLDGIAAVRVPDKQGSLSAKWNEECNAILDLEMAG
jgi:hypothetical protein